jgi:hypothetical protein
MPDSSGLGTANVRRYHALARRRPRSSRASSTSCALHVALTGARWRHAALQTATGQVYWQRGVHPSRNAVRLTYERV